MKFRDYFSVKHIIFAVVLMALMLGFAVRQSNNVVKVSFSDEAVKVTATKYSMTIAYADIESVQLMAWPEDLGEKVTDGYDDDIVRYGTWKNEAWGEYTVCADPDTSKCIVVHINDGRTLVFSRKDDATTKEIYETLLEKNGQ